MLATVLDEDGLVAIDGVSTRAAPLALRARGPTEHAPSWTDLACASRGGLQALATFQLPAGAIRSSSAAAAGAP